MRLLRLKTVLIAIDLDETGSGALRTAEMVAEAAGAALHVVHVSNSGDESGTVTELHATLRRTGLAIDEAATHVVAGEPSHAINLLADRIGADVIVLGPHRRRDATGLGSTALAVVTNAAVPCLVARSLLRLPLQRTVVAVDLSPRMVELALALANGLVAFSGALIAQYQGFADVTMGVGTLVAGMAAVILGETLKPRRARLGGTIIMVAIGAIVFRALIALALRLGLNPIDLKLATAAFVLLTLALPNFNFGFRRTAAVAAAGGAGAR